MSKIAALLVACAVGACTSVAPMGTSSVEQLIRKLDDQERIAALSRNIPAMERLWSADFTVNAPNNRVAAGRQAVLDTFVHGNIINFSSFDRTVEFIKVDGNFAIIMGEEKLTPTVDAPQAGLRAGQTTSRRYTNIWKNEGDAWRLYWRHANVMPPR